MFRQIDILLYASVLLIWTHVYADVCSGPNETDHICGRLCSPTCDNPNPHSFLCPGIVCIQGLTSGCRCNSGYVRNTTNGSCVLISECSL